MLNVLIWIILAISIVIIILSMIMAPRSNSFSGALVGSSDLELFKISKERGRRLTVKYLMFAMGFLLLILSIVIRLYM